MSTPQLAIKNGKLTHFISENDILYLIAEGAYTCIKLTEDQQITHSKKLKEVEESLASSSFFRVHHSYIVNLCHVVHYCNNGENYLQLSNGDRLPLARSRKASFFKLFRRL